MLSADPNIQSHNDVLPVAKGFKDGDDCEVNHIMFA